MASLTAKQESFIRLMTESEELARRGFELLLKRPDLENFFVPLQAAGMFDPIHNPPPVPAEEEGYVCIPYWSALDYLTAVAALSGRRNDLELANKVMSVIRSVASWRDSEGRPRENYHTAHKFAAIFGLVPTSAVTTGDLEFIPLWLKDRFERMLVGKALEEGALPNFLSSSIPGDVNKAVLVLRYCTAIEWRGQGKPSMALDDFWARLLISRHARTFGEKAGAKAAEVFLERVREIFGTGTRELYSQTYRPAIEDNFQNHAWHEAENCAVEGLRDVLLSWCEHDSLDAKPFVEALLTDKLQIVRRIGIYVLGQQWTAFRDLYSKILSPELFDAAHIHELYDLLCAHYADFTDDEKAKTLHIIREIPQPTWADDPTRSLKRIQQRWLSAITGKGHTPTDEWFAQLQADSSVGPLPEHPDFDSYMSKWVGPGASPYSNEELVAFALDRTIVEKLNAFEERDPFRGPTMDGLTAGLERAARTVPGPFLEVLPDFLQAKSRFQYSVISGLKQAWEAGDRDPSSETNWNRGWERIVSFSEKLIRNADFWKVKDDVMHDWVASAIADYLQAGTSKDDRAYSPDLFPRTQELLAILLEKAHSIAPPSDDPMTQALNSPKGRVVEALFSHALRACRVGDAATKSHEGPWNGVRTLFESEFAKCTHANYEFSTLCGAYIGQLCYIDPQWTKMHLLQIFPAEFPLNSICAVEGLGYASFTRPVYSMLADSDVLDRALRYDLKGRVGREKLLERIAAAYLWGDEPLESARFSYIFDVGKIEDLQTVAKVFWMLRGEPLSVEQKERVIKYWDRCLVWCRALSAPPTALLSSLSLLACYLNTADGREGELLQAVAPFVYFGHNSYEFVNELARLAHVSPDGVSIALGLMIKARVPEFDYDDQLKKLLRTLAEKDKKQDVILYAEQMRGLPGMQDLFDNLTRGK